MMIRPRTGTDDIHVYLCWYEFFFILFFKIQHWGTTAIFNNPYSSFQFLKIYMYMNLCTTSLLFYTTDTKHHFFWVERWQTYTQNISKRKKNDSPEFLNIWRGGRGKKIYAGHLKGMGWEGLVPRPFFGNFKHTCT